LFENIFTRFDTVHERDRQTDEGRTDGQTDVQRQPQAAVVRQKCEEKIDKCVSKTHVDKRGGAVKLCATPPPPFERQHLRH